MGKALIIAEKPSVASDIARALGGFKKQEDYYENDEYIVSSAVGHLLELVVPEGVEPARGKWSFAHLPVIPPHFDLQPIERTQSRLRALAKLVKRKDVDAIINACDAGREGELIFRNIIRYTRASQPIQRLWLQSMTPTAIRDVVPRDYWEVIGTFQAESGPYTGKWIDEKFARADKDGDADLRADRLWEREKAEAIRAKCLGKPGIVTEESKPTTQIAPLL